MIVLAVIQKKGGVGKTFCALSIAQELVFQSRNKLRILVVDMDPSYDATTTILGDEGLKKINATIFHLFSERNFDAKKAIYKGSDEFPGISVIAGDGGMETVETVLAGRALKEQILKNKLSEIKDIDVVILDTQGSQGFLAKCALIAANAYIIPIEPDRNAINGVHSANDLVEELIADQAIDKKHPPKFLGAFFTGISKTTRIAQKISDEAKEVFGKKLLPYSIPYSIHCSEAIDSFTTLQFEKKHPVAIAYRKLGKYVGKELNMRGN